MTSASTTRWATDYEDVRPARNFLSAAGLRGCVRHAALSVGGRILRPRQDSFLRCLYFHYVYDDQVDAFRRVLSRLKQLGTFVDTARVRRAVTGEQPIEGRLFHLSIDDGFDNVHRNALPVMDKLGIRAAVFVPTRFVGADDDDVRRRSWKGDLLPTRPMDWRRVKEVRASGHDVGAHTRHHTRLSDVSGDPERLRDELEGSRADLEQALGERCTLMSWPYGTGSDVDERSLAAIGAAGYETCFSAVRGRVMPGQGSVLTIPRHHFEPEWPWSHVRFFALGGRD